MARTYRASFVLQGFASTFVLILLFQVGRLVERASPSDACSAPSWKSERLEICGVLAVVCVWYWYCTMHEAGISPHFSTSARSSGTFKTAAAIPGRPRLADTYLDDLLADFPAVMITGALEKTTTAGRSGWPALSGLTSPALRLPIARTPMRRCAVLPGRCWSTRGSRSRRFWPPSNVPSTRTSRRGSCC